MIDQELLAKLTSPDYGPVLHGFSKHLDPPPAKKISFYPVWKNGMLVSSSRPSIPWNAFDKVDAAGKRICRINGCGKPVPGGGWKSCGHEHSRLFEQAVRYYDWDYTRYDVFKRDKFACQLCGLNLRTESHEHGYTEYNDKPYQCDHIIPWAYVLVKFQEMPILEKIHRFYLNRENLRTLCESCHRSVTATFLAFLPKVKRGADFGLVPLTSFL